ncbi:HEPN domain-containing protein [uncultured Luteimonas sp.]|uniref:HEPN domain-containing protein n=1 Tax=uncultured Luteimonas sp. TaxID=453144 RepID=UPI00262B2F77|nr:HEPN domain-containing protein [uncultured Luteimonas sp.]
MPVITSDALKARHQQVRDDQPEGLRVRIHRAISWLARAEREAEDPDAAFIFLWIALNAAYAHEFGFEERELVQIRRFIAVLVEHDLEQRLHAVLFRQFSGPIRTLIDNRFVYEPFWRALREHDGSGRWERQFSDSREIAMRTVLEKRVDVLLQVILDRLYMLRNQLVHGGTTWASSVNRAQLRDGVAILGTLVPVILALMVEMKDVDLGQEIFPALHI